MVTVKLYGNLRRKAGANSAKLDNPGTVLEAMAELVERHPELGGALYGESENIKSYYSIFVDGRNVNTIQGMDTVLSGDESIAIFPPVGGG